MFSDNITQKIAEAAKKIMDEQLKGNQKAIDKNHNGKVDGQDFAILRGEKKAIKEEDAYDKDRYAVKNGKAVKDNPAHMGSKDEPHHVWAKSADEALKKKMKEEVELEEGIEDRLEAARAKAKAAGKPIKDKPTPPKSNVRKIEGSAYGGARQKDEPEEDDDDTPAKKTVKYGARQNYKRSTRVNESFTEMLTRYDQEGLKPFIESLSREEEEELIDDLSTEIADETLDVIDAGNYTEVTIGEEADTEEFTKNLETNKAKSSGKVKQPDLAKGDVMAVKNEEVELTERHMTDAEMQKRETIVKSMKKGLSGFKQRYGDRAKNVMYATATKQAMK